MNLKKAVILLSGGLDSATTAAIAVNKGFSLSGLTFSYNQRHDVEIEYAKKMADFFKFKKHHLINIPSGIFNSALISKSEIEVPKIRGAEGEIPSTYVPARNIIFLSYCLAYAESIEAETIFIGANAVDYSGYPDCRPDFFKAFQNMANIGTKTGVEGRGIKIETPLIDLKKSQIIKMGFDLGVDYSMTISCYDPDKDGRSCGKCDSCHIRKLGFKEAGIADPTPYSL
jgi:7-cyano-7-deazaguanine synthase